jgi:pimeloyl-ACP methyl ester carboxylesterase
VKLEIIAKLPPVERGRTPLLFVPGMQHGAWCWDVHFLDYFARHGYPSYAVSLRGHGRSEGRERLRWTRIADYADDVASAVAQLPASPILIGHSMGGFVLQKYLEDHRAPGAVLLSSPSPAGMLGTALRVARRRPLVFARVSLTFSLLPLIATPELAREAFLSDDLPHDELVSYWERMEDDSYAAFLDMVALDLPKPAKVTTPLLVIGVGRDNMLTAQDAVATARAYNARLETIPDVAHDSMLEVRWQAVADRILGWLKVQAPSSGESAGMVLAERAINQAAVAH